MIREEIFVNASIIVDVFSAESFSGASDFQLSLHQANASTVSRDARSPFANFSLFSVARIYN
jgi:hypothetical protein